ncbi:MAG TPA: TonB-dependent receptor [Chitinophagaceae bacterium]
MKNRKDQTARLLLRKTPTVLSTLLQHSNYKLRNCLLATLMTLASFQPSVFAQVLTNSKTETLPTRPLRGVVIDNVVQAPIEGATVSIPALGLTTLTDAGGTFRFAAVPIGVQQVAVSHISYREVLLENISVISGKETVLTIAVESRFQDAEAVVVQAKSKRNRPLNDMSAVSARAFTVEETQKYAAAINDPSRMATAFPGVMAADDGNNNIIIRGNSPTGLLWRMEGVDIPNPNHFSSAGSSGGGISILSTQLLSNSDFITGAFASEYGNALSGVFDLKLRKGNNEKREYALQAGVLGLNVAVEGPIRSLLGASYLVNYRYSTLSLLNKMGIPLEAGSTDFQDLSYHVYLPTAKAGTFSLFGFGGLSSQDIRAEEDSAKWEGRWDRYHSEFVSNTGAAGLTHNILLGSHTFLRSALATSYNKLESDYQYLRDDFSTRNDYTDRYITRKTTLSSTLNHKFSPRSVVRGGAIVSLIGSDYYQKSKENETAPLLEVINSRGSTQTLQGFGQWQYKLRENVTLNGGVHYLRLAYNGSSALEPRASLKWEVNKKNTLSVGYGGHSQVQPLGVYFARVIKGDGSVEHPNRELDLTRTQHGVLSYHRVLGRNLALKAEAYYQHLYDVPVATSDTSTFSLLNVQGDYVTDPLVNRGKGRNYGIELSLEKYLAHQFYYTASTSWYQSKYTAADGVERNTRFNGNYIVNFIGGKDFLSASRLRTFGMNLRLLYAGGLRTTPIDLERSLSNGYVVYREKEAYTQQNEPYFRSDLRLSLKWNRARLTSTLSLDIQNITNRLNVYGQFFDSEKGEVVTTRQTGLIPVLNYKVEF